MSIQRRSMIATGMRLVAFVAIGAMAVWAVVPTRWILSGSNPSGYESKVDATTKHNDLPTTYLKARTAEVSGFGTLMLDVRAQEYQGKRVRLRAAVKSKDVRKWAGLWMRVDKSRGATPLAFDNMFNRPIQGSTDWQSYEVVLDVAEDASAVSFGIVLTGPGEVWISDVRLEVVARNVPTTGMPIDKQKWQKEHPERMEPGWTPIYPFR